MIENPFYPPEVHGSYEHFDLGDLVLEEGRAMLRRSMRPAGTCAGSGWKPLRARVVIGTADLLEATKWHARHGRASPYR